MIIVHLTKTRRNKLKFIIPITLLLLLLVTLIVSPVYAISNPTNISFGSGFNPMYKVFENVAETDDMLFVVEGFVNYASDPTDYTASEAFLFEVLSTDGTEVLASTPLKAYGDRPISIYQTAAQVTSANLTSGTAYGLRITGNPIIFASPTGNTVTTYLNSDDYIDQSVATDESNPLRDFLMLVAINMEAEDSVSTYIVDVQGVKYLTSTGGALFLAGIPNLSAVCSVLFQIALEPLESDVPSSTGAYASSLTVAGQWGNTVASGLTMFGTYLGINQALAGSVILFGLVMAFAVFLYRKTQSGVAVLLLVAATPFMGAYLGLMPMALAFILVIFIIVLGGYFFFSRGAL